jgi:DNA-directed RNA polymerase specialized sigma24 family protein
MGQTMLGPTELRALDARPTELDFEGFFRAEYPQLARAGYLLTGEAAEAEDLAQEAMARTFERWDRVRAMESPAGYVYRTCPYRATPGRSGSTTSGTGLIWETATLW